MTEEMWLNGIPLFVLSIDLKKAFDSVNLDVIGKILLSYGVPCHLVNRIISAVLHERTAVRWGGRCTSSYVKSRGVKQGCPISPYLFVCCPTFCA